MRRPVRAVLVGGIVAATAAVGIAVAFVVGKRINTGEWEMPTGDDLVRVKRKLSGPQEPAKVIYLHRGAVELAGGADDAPRHRSSVVERAGHERLVLPGYRGSYRQWQLTMKCVRNLFEPFDVVVTDALPVHKDYLLVVVGGRPGDLKGKGGGKAHRHVAGLAPFSPGQVIPRAVVFAFSQELKNRPRAVCETIGMEVAHTFGLDHAHSCKDVMTYLSGCGRKSFTDRDVSCGEKKKRECADGKKTQNSYRRLLEVLGPAAR